MNKTEPSSMTASRIQLLQEMHEDYTRGLKQRKRSVMAVRTVILLLFARPTPPMMVTLWSP